jgi:hypothetical protein
MSIFDSAKLPVTRATRQRFCLGFILPLALCTLVAAPSVRAQDYVVTLERSFLERAVEDAVTQTVLASEPALHWGHVSGRRVEVTRKDQDSINIDLDLAFDTVIDPEVDVDIEVGFGCFWAAPDLKLSLPRFDVDVNFPWYVDVATGGLSWVGGHVANVIIDRKIASMEAVRRQLVQTINQQLGQVGFELCPAFEVTEGGAVRVIFGQGSECTPGQTRHKRCPSNTQGSGYDDTCINGYWERTGGICEPVAPPGGEQP